MMHRCAMRRIAPLALLAAGLAGCVVDAPVVSVAPPVARFEDLATSWQPEPFAVAPEVVAQAERVCRVESGVPIPPGYQLRIVDARGAARLLLVFAGVGNGYADCELRAMADGRLRSEGGGVLTNAHPIDARPDAVEVMGAGRSSGGGGGEDSAYVVGRAGLEIAEVRVIVDGGSEVHASLRDGLFAAWWPGGSDWSALHGYGRAGTKLAETSHDH
jgi:hypothetical protein